MMPFLFASQIEAAPHAGDLAPTTTELLVSLASMKRFSSYQELQVLDWEARMP